MPTTVRTMRRPSERTEPAPAANQTAAPASPIVFDPTARAIRTLSDQGMPHEEIEAVLDASEPDVLRRFMELHRERLDERLAAERRALAELERSLALAILERTGQPTDRERPSSRPT